MDLYGAALTVRMILQSASGGMKGVPDRHIEVLVHLAIDHQLVAGHGQIDPHPVGPPLRWWRTGASTTTRQLTILS